MTASQIHAAILGTSLVLSSGIFVVRRSMTQREVGGRVVEEPEVVRPVVKAPEAPSEGHEKELEKASRLMKEAREILQAAQRMDNNEAQMLEVRKLVDEAQVILESLPEDDPGVVAKKREHQVLHLDAVKLSNL